jgi:hypothetical protein
MVHSLSQLQFAPEHLAPQLAPETWLQILAARVNLEPEDEAMMEALLRRDVNWHGVITDSGKLGVHPLLYRHLSQNGFSKHVPPTVMNQLENAYRWQSLRNLCLTGLTEQILTACEDAGITVVFLKGAFLARWIYPDIALRPMADVDLLCRIGDEEPVRAKLAGLGFHQEAGPVRAKLGKLGFPQTVSYPNFFHERFFAVDKGCHLNPFVRSPSSMIEVHFSIFPSIPHGFAHMDEVWARAGRHLSDDLSPGCLAPDDLILHLCLHLMRHIRYGQCRLYWFCDLHEVLVHYRDSLAWERLFATVAALGVTDQVRSILFLLSRYWHSPVPEMQGPVKELSLGTILQDHLRRNRKESDRTLLRKHFHKLGTLLAAPGWRERAHFFWRLMFPSRDDLIRRYRPQNSLQLCRTYLVHSLMAVKQATESLLYGIRYLLKKH